MKLSRFPAHLDCFLILWLNVWAIMRLYRGLATLAQYLINWRTEPNELLSISRKNCLPISPSEQSLVYTERHWKCISIYGTVLRRDRAAILKRGLSLGDTHSLFLVKRHSISERYVFAPFDKLILNWMQRHQHHLLFSDAKSTDSTRRFGVTDYV